MRERWEGADVWFALIGGFVLGCVCSGIAYSFMLYAG